MRNKIKMNPILKKELMVGSRTMKMAWTIFAINLVLTAIVALGLYIIDMVSSYNNYSYSTMIALFPILSCTECLILALGIPIMTAGSISGERERQTLDIMLTTPVKPMSIAVGKLESAVVLVMTYMISSLPALSICFILGGMSWIKLLGLMAMMLFLGIYVGSIGVFCSSVVKKTVVASLVSFFIIFAIGLGTFMLFLVVLGMEQTYCSVNNMVMNFTWEGIILMMNPAVTFVDFIMQSVSQHGVADWMNGMTGSVSGTFFKELYEHFLPVSVALNLAVSYLFLRLAARNIVAVRRKKKKK